jgi:hypothetical protein
LKGAEPGEENGVPVPVAALFWPEKLNAPPADGAGAVIWPPSTKPPPAPPGAEGGAFGALEKPLEPAGKLPKADAAGLELPVAVTPKENPALAPSDCEGAEDEAARKGLVVPLAK